MSELVLFIDSGDTLVDESTQVFDAAGNVLRAEFFPGTEAALAALARAGVPMVMVADGRHRSFENVYAGHPVGALFAARVYSEDVGAEKPDGRMFRAALAACGLTERDADRVVMVGNNVARDVAGANRMGFTSVLIDRSPRYDYTPHGPDERPDYVIHRLEELAGVLAEVARRD
ncbi:MAG: HAD family hydrolase [Christensenellales bacterium]|jgi:FMN phosphatase YigB (HAD superfamily)